MKKFHSKEELMNSTISEILGQPKDNPPSKKFLELIGLVLTGLHPDSQHSHWYVDPDYGNDGVHITLSDTLAMRSTFLVFNNKEDIGMRLFLIFLTFTHHHKWHKPISLGSLTLSPFDREVPSDKIGENASGWKTYREWYPPLAEQEKFFREHPEKVEGLFQKFGILEQVNELREELK